MRNSIIKYFLFVSFILFCLSSNAQNDTENSFKGQKGQTYFYWGWNWAWYGKSDIHYKGDDYDFVLKNVAAKDRQTKFDLNKYFNPLKFTTPQYNFRVGYFIKDNVNISFGIDHMKYVAQNHQDVIINGFINNTETSYNDIYENELIHFSDDFAHFEHTDGLNYINLEVRRSDFVIDLNKIDINLISGVGGGFLYPKTNSSLLNYERHDEFNVAGYGLGAVVGFNAVLNSRFFIQSEWKNGIFNLPNIRTTSSKTDGAKQSFFYSQVNFVLGTHLNLNRKDK